MTEEKMKDLLNPSWSTYKHIHDVRSNNISNSVLLLAIPTAVLPILNALMFQASGIAEMLIPIVFYLTSMLILFTKTKVKGQIPWISVDDTVNLDKDNSFYSSLMADIKTAEKNTLLTLKKSRMIIKTSITITYMAILLTVLSYPLLMLFNATMLFYTISLIMVLVAIITSIKTISKKLPFDFDWESKKIKNTLTK